MSIRNVVLSMPATATSGMGRNSLGNLELLDTGEVRWSLYGADGGGRPLLTLTIAPTLIDKARISHTGAMTLTDEWSIDLRSQERAERFRDAVRNVAFHRV